ncbi:hypothetical protein BN1232_03192 [Mycobacterium lentiflavum]|uniref:Uncharacterized protein n=1 Tax=Mycobacterium lentiflavum TaxID=141349 RepID=A0A0E4H1L5_MYCLN|nr:hypothetical protein BN1232_03192 [Mycobacterium lentiflavum]
MGNQLSTSTIPSGMMLRNCQDLWIEVFQATSVPACQRLADAARWLPRMATTSRSFRSAAFEVFSVGGKEFIGELGISLDDGAGDELCAD